MKVDTGAASLSNGLATLAVLRNARKGNHCGNCRHSDPALAERATPRPGICGNLTGGRIACAKWEAGP